MRLEHGFPTVYRTFLSNIIHKGLQEVRARVRKRVWKR